MCVYYYGLAALRNVKNFIGILIPRKASRINSMILYDDNISIMKSYCFNKTTIFMICYLKKDCFLQRLQIRNISALLHLVYHSLYNDHLILDTSNK